MSDIKSITRSRSIMSILLVQSCSATKNDVDGKVPAIDLYDGYFFKILKKADREASLNGNLDILVLSAEHGILELDDEIELYDRRMTRDRAEELHSEVVQQVTAKIDEKDYDRVIFNLGRDYREAVKGVEKHVPSDIDVEFIEGEGIGEKGNKLKKLVVGTSLEDFL